VRAVPTAIEPRDTLAIVTDFVNPLCFLPGEQNTTLQLTIYNFYS
jgi:raffinose/stachyose/melibiose transport system permease protein